MTGRVLLRGIGVAKASISNQADTWSAMAVVQVQVFRDNAAAGGQDVNVIEVQVRFDGIHPAANMPVKLELQDYRGLPASDITLYLDPDLQQVVRDGTVTTRQDGKIYVYATSDAPAAAYYVITGYALCYAEQPSRLVLMHFTAPDAQGPADEPLEVQPLNAMDGAPVTIVAMGACTTTLKLRLTLNNQPYCGGPFSGAVTAPENVSAGDVRFDVPYSNADGEIRVDVLPSRQGSLTLALSDSRTGNHAEVPIDAVVLRDGSVRIEATPSSVTTPVDGVTFTAFMEDIDGHANPSGIVLGWKGLDDYSRQLCPSSAPGPTGGDLASRQMTSAGVTETALLAYPNGGIAVRLEIYGTREPIGFDCVVPFHPTVEGLVAPCCDIGAQTNGGVLIDDGTYMNLDTPSIPIRIPAAADPLSDGRSLVSLYAHIDGGAPLNPASDIPLACNLWRVAYGGLDLPMAVPLSSGILDRNQAMDLYYVMNNRPNTAISQPLRIIVDRHALDDIPSQLNLPQPLPQPRNYLIDDHANGPLNVTVKFLNQHPPNAGDWIQMYLTLSGRTEANLNELRSFLLSPYVIQATDIPASGPVTIEFGAPDGPPGFPASLFDGIDLSDGRLYFTQWDGKTLAVSPYRGLIVDTVTPYTAGAFLRKLLPSS